MRVENYSQGVVYMWKKKLVAGLLCCSIIVSSGLALAEEDYTNDRDNAPKQEQKMELTKKQQKEVAPFVEKMFESKRAMLQKYMEVGAVDKELGEKMLKRMDEKQQKMKEEGYALYCPYRKKLEKQQ